MARRIVIGDRLSPRTNCAAILDVHVIPVMTHILPARVLGIDPTLVIALASGPSRPQQAPRGRNRQDAQVIADGAAERPGGYHRCDALNAA
jgi:hypothetical protein